MKPLLLIWLFCLSNFAFAQSLDYISVRKQNGQVVKNFYSGSTILLQLNDGSYLAGPVQTIRNDSVYVTLYDIRYYPTTWGTYVKDTISTTLAGVRFDEVSRIHLSRRRTFFQRTSGPLLMLGGGGYLVVNLLNGAFYDYSLTDKRNVRRIGIAAGAVGLGYLLTRLFASDGFSKKKHHLVYVNL
jgi:hypothetical protein